MDYSNNIRKEINLILDGEKIYSKETLLSTLKEGLCFPDYFGFNWDALQDCITVLSWLKGVHRIAIFIKNSSKLMKDEPNTSLQTFFEILDYAVSFWDDKMKEELPLNSMDIAFGYSLE